MAAIRVALLRGINVGRAKRVAMADLRALVEDLGYREVRTVLNSGNVVFTVAATVRSDPAPRIERGLATRLGVTARVTVLTAAELAAALARNPLARVADDPSRMQVAVPRRPSDRALLGPLARRDWAPEAFALGARVAYLWCPNGMIESPLAQAVARAMGEHVTTRNWATMARLHAVAGGTTGER